MDTLVLSTAYQPMNKVSWKEAMTLWASGKVEIISEYEDRFIKTSSKLFKIPSVIRFVKNVFKKWNRTIKFSKTNIFYRDDGKCQYCSKQVSIRESTFDHITPKSRGGKTNWTNIVISCFKCNQKKRNMFPREAGMKLLKKPLKPSSIKERDGFKIKNIPEDWKIWISNS